MKGFYPSTAERWVNCHASVALAEPYWDMYQTGEARQEGIAAHEVVERMAVGEIIDVGSLTANNVVVTDEMIEGAQMYLDEVGAGATFETKVSCAPVSKDMNTVPDAFRYDRDDAKMYIWDYKFGHSEVEAFENAQLIVEASAFLEYQPASFVFVIVQPRCFTGSRIKKWEVSFDDYMTNYLPRYQAAASVVEAGTGVTNTGSHCLKCPARHACTALQQSAHLSVDICRQPSTIDLTGDALGYELGLLMDAENRIKARISGLETQAIVEMDNGRAVKGFGMEASYGNKDWTVPSEAVFALGSLLQVDLRKPSKPITPAQAIKAGVDEKSVAAISGAAYKGTRLKRLNINKLKGVFKK